MNNNPIPLESDFNWWWYRSKNNFLKHLIKLHTPNNGNLKVLEIGPGLGNNLKLLHKIGEVDLVEVEKKFIDYNNQNNSNLFRSIFTSLDDINEKYDLVFFLMF